jgi:plasmid replication initiation protein
MNHEKRQILTENDKNNKVAGTPNVLIENRLRFKGDIHSHRLFLAMLWRAYEGADITTDFDLDASIVTRDELDEGRAYAAMKRACRIITGEVIDLMEGRNDGFDFTTVVQRAKHIRGTGKIKVCFSPALVPIVQNMFTEGRYTKIFLKHAMPIRSLYSVRLYELLLQYKKFGSRDVSVDDLRRKLDIPDGKFQRWNNIKDSIIIPAQAHLKENTDVSFDFVTHKEGRKVVGVHFLIFDNVPTVKVKDGLQTDLFESTVVENPPVPRHVQIIRDNLWKTSQEEALKRYSPSYIEHYYTLAKNKESMGGVKIEFKGFFYTMLHDDPEKFEEQEIERKKGIRAKELQEEQQKRNEMKAEQEYDIAEAEFEKLPIDEQQKFIDRTPMFGSAAIRKTSAIQIYAMGKLKSIGKAV